MEGHTITGGTGHVFAEQLTNLVSPKNTQGFKSSLPLDHLGYVVDGIVITSSAGMLTLDVLGAVGGPACHNKGLLQPKPIAIEYETLVCNSLTVTMGISQGWELSNQIVQATYIRSLLVGQSQAIQFPFYTDKRIAHCCRRPSCLAIHIQSKYIHYMYI